MLRQIDSFYKKAGLSFLMRFGGLGLQFAGSIFVARMLGASGFGAFALASTWAVFFDLMLSFGLGELSVREIPSLLAKGRKAAVLLFFKTVALTMFVSIAISTTAFYALEQAGLLVLSPGWKFVAALAAVQGIILTISHVLNAFHRIMISQFLETIVRPLLYLFVLFLVVSFGLGLTSKNVFVTSTIAAIPVLLVMFWVIFRAWKQESGDAAHSDTRVSLWFTAAIPVLLTAFFNRLQLDLDVMMVGAMLGDFEVGIYRAAARGALLLSIANMVALQLVGPMLSRALAMGGIDEAQGLLSRVAVVSFAAGFPIFLILGFGAPYFLALYGPDFTRASFALQLLLLGQVTIIFAGADAILLIMLHREKTVTLVTTIGVALNFFLNLTLIKSHGIEGAAIASVVSMAFVRIVLVAIIRRTTEFDTTFCHC